MPEHQVALKVVTPEVEVAVLEPQLFRGKLFGLPARDGNRRRCRRPDHTQRRRAHLDVAGAHVGIPHREGTLRDRTFQDHDGLGAKAGCQRAHLSACRARVEGHLHQPRSIAKVHEHQPAEIACAMHPASQLDDRPGVFGAEVATRVRSQPRSGRVGHYRWIVREVVRHAGADSDITAFAGCAFNRVS